MEKDEGLTKLWIEKHVALPGNEAAKKATLLKKKFNLDKKTVAAAKLFLQKNHLTWQELLLTTGGVLLNRLSTAQTINYGIASLVSDKNNAIKIEMPIQVMNSSIDDKTSFKSLLTKTKKQFNSKKTADYSVDTVRYLLLLKSTAKNKKSTEIIDVSRFPLMFSTDIKKISSFQFIYNPMVFSEQNIKFIFDHFTVLLNEVIQDINQKAVTINILTAHEKKQILQQWRQPQYSFTVPELTLSVHDMVSKFAKNNPEHMAVSYRNTVTTYKELDTAATQLAGLLLSKGVKKSDPICVLMERTPALIMVMLAIFKCGAMYVPLNPKYPNDRIDFIINDCQPTFILVNDTERLSDKNAKIAMIIESSVHSFSEGTATVNLPQVNPEQVAYIIYTSGTTGTPKGVMIKHKSLTNFIAWYIGCFNITDEDRASQFASQGFDTFFCETIPMLGVGGSIHIVDDNIKLTPTLFFDWLQLEKITILDLPTSYAFMLFSLRWPTPNNIRLLKIGGENMTHYPDKKYSFDIWNIYGPTEATIECIYMKVYAANSTHPTTKNPLPPIGKPIINSEIYVVDKFMQPVPVGIVGELLIGGDNLAPGYLNREELTQQKFIPNPFKQKSYPTLYKTGDLVTWLPDGNIEFIGRTDDQVKIRGYRIELGDIENAISQYSDVNEAVVIVKEDIRKEKSLIAYVVPNLDKERYLYQMRCLLSIDNNRTFIETTTEDISKYGVALFGVNQTLNLGQEVSVHFKLPGFNEPKTLAGIIIWQQGNRCGISYELSDEDNAIVAKSIDYYLSTHNIMELLFSSAAKRSLRKALRKKIPDYMVPAAVVTLMQFPLTLSGKIDIKALPPPKESDQLVGREFIPAKTKTEKKLVTIWSSLLKKTHISMADNFFDLGANSLTTTELALAIMQDFNIVIPAQILLDLSYIPILAEYIDTNGASYAKETETQDEIMSDAELATNIIPTGKLSPNVKEPQNILLTGAGGFLGIYLLRELLRNTQAKIYCLIRQGDFETAAKRLMATIESFNLSDEITLAERRIIAIPSDISFHNFGLPQEQYNSLLDKIDLIIHCGAQVNIMSSYNKMRGSNVIGTLEIIKFATQRVDKPIHYISTLSSAYLKNEAGDLVEEFPTEQYGELFGGYAISKWVAERLLTEIKNRGLPVAIYRSGYILGRSDTGATSVNDALLYLIKSCIQLGYAPDMQEKITLLPVDFVSRAITKITLAYPDKNNVYHVEHPTGILWTDLVKWLNHYGYAIKIIPMREWKEKLKNASSDNALYPFLPYYLALKDDYKSADVSIDHARDVLTEMGIRYPNINDKLLTIYFNFLCKTKFLPMPDKILEQSVSMNVEP